MKLRLLDPEVLVCVTILLSTRQSSSSASVHGRLPHPFWPTRWRVLAACLVAMLGFCLPQEIPLEYWPLSEPSNGQLYLQFKARFEVAGAYYRSEDFAGTGWWKPKTVTVTADALESPNGSKSADILQAGAGKTSMLCAQSLPKDRGEVWSWSIFVRRQNHDHIGLLLGETKRMDWPHFDFSTGRCTVPADMGQILRAEKLGDGWWRLSLSGKLTQGAKPIIAVLLLDTQGRGGLRLRGDEQVTVWGSQLEAGLVMSPYYPSGLVASDHRGAGFMFHPNFGRGFRPLEVIRIPISHSGQSLTYTLPLLDAPLCGLRLTPVDRPGVLVLERVRLIDRAGREIHAITPADYVPADGGGFVVEGEVVRLVSGTQLSTVELRLSHPLVPEGMNGRNFQRCFRSLAYLAGMLALIVGCVAWLAGRRLTWRQGLRLAAFMLLLSGLFSVVAQRGLLKNSITSARLASGLVPR